MRITCAGCRSSVTRWRTRCSLVYPSRSLQGSLALGGLVAGLATAMLIAIFSQNARLREDTVIGVFFGGAFGLGIVVLSLTPGYSGSLESFLFGQILGISDGDVLNVAIGGLLLPT